MRSCEVDCNLHIYESKAEKCWILKFVEDVAYVVYNWECTEGEKVKV